MMLSHKKRASTRPIPLWRSWGASAFADQALVNRAARASRPSGIDPSRKADHAHSGRNEKPDLYAVATRTKVRPYLALPRY